MKLTRWTFMVLMIFGIINCSKDKEDEDSGIDINKSIVINELLPKNTQYGYDEDGEFDDWIELYNLACEDIDLSGFYLTDSKNDLTKWQFPDTIIAKNGYLIIWADGDSLQIGLHTPYKLSALGETVLLLSPAKEVVDQVKYPATDAEQSWARLPNGTGSFGWATPTFGQANE